MNSLLFKSYIYKKKTVTFLTICGLRIIDFFEILLIPVRGFTQGKLDN